MCVYIYMSQRTSKWNSIGTATRQAFIHTIILIIVTVEVNDDGYNMYSKTVTTL